MNRYFHKAVSALRSVSDTCRTKGVGAGFCELKGKLWRRSCSILYVKQGGQEPVVVPEDIRIVTVTAEQGSVFLADILAAGAGADIRFFDSGAICFLVYKNKHPVGLGWLFRNSYLLEKIQGQIKKQDFIINQPSFARQSRATQGRQTTTSYALANGIYLAGFHVAESARGQGIYPLLLNVMCRDAAVEGGLCYVDVALRNKASIRGIKKAGFELVGELRTMAIVGIIIRCKIEEDFTANLH